MGLRDIYFRWKMKKIMRRAGRTIAMLDELRNIDHSRKKYLSLQFVESLVKHLSNVKVDSMKKRY